MLGSILQKMYIQTAQLRAINGAREVKPQSTPLSMDSFTIKTDEDGSALGRVPLATTCSATVKLFQGSFFVGIAEKYTTYL